MHIAVTSQALGGSSSNTHWLPDTLPMPSNTIEFYLIPGLPQYSGGKIHGYFKDHFKFKDFKDPF